MKVDMITHDLFKVDLSKYVLAHCISRDIKMGAGIALVFRQKYPDMPSILSKMRPEVGKALLYQTNHNAGIYNLITKQLYWHKPTYDSLRLTLYSLKAQMLENGQKYLAIPYLMACGLDRLNWNKVQTMLAEVFDGTEIEILICKK